LAAADQGVVPATAVGEVDMAEGEVADPVGLAMTVDSDYQKA